MRESTFSRIREEILRELRAAGGVTRAGGLGTASMADYVREVRVALEAEGVVRTWKDMTTKHHPLMVELVQPENEAMKNDVIIWDY